MTFEKMKQKNPTEASEVSVKDKADDSASATQPTGFTPKIMHAPSFQDENEGRRGAARPKVNRAPEGLLESSRTNMKALEGPKAAADNESMLPPLDLKKTRTLDWKFTLAIVALVIIINAIIGMTLGKNSNGTATPTNESAATPAPAASNVSPQERVILESPAQLSPSSGVPAGSDSSLVVEPPAATAPASQTAPAASAQGTTAAPDANGSQDLMSIINRY